MARKNISVIAYLYKNGCVVPKQVIWEDGRVFEVDRALDVRKAILYSRMEAYEVPSRMCD